jgi:hypothetical protein
MSALEDPNEGARVHPVAMNRWSGLFVVIAARMYPAHIRIQETSSRQHGIHHANTVFITSRNDGIRGIPKVRSTAKINLMDMNFQE